MLQCSSSSMSETLDCQVRVNLLVLVIVLTTVVEIYPAVQRLAKMLQIDYSWKAVATRRVNSVSAHPEIQMISLIVIATKLAHPFDNIPRYPESESEATIVRIDWEKWVSTMKDAPSRGLKRGEEIKVTEADVPNMNAKEMDDYLDWYQRTWVNDSDPKSTFLS